MNLLRYSTGGLLYKFGYVEYILIGFVIVSSFKFILNQTEKSVDIVKYLVYILHIADQLIHQERERMSRSDCPSSHHAITEYKL